jgi:hypothetical protein
MRMNKKILVVILLAMVALITFSLYELNRDKNDDENEYSIYKYVTLTGNFECLSRKEAAESIARECVFGFRSDTGEAYAVNFGASASAARLFEERAHVRAEGNVVPREALSTNQWDGYNIVGIFTITSMQETVSATNGKLNIEEVCRSALAYTTFESGDAAESFVQECIEGKRPEVIERYKQDMGLSADAAL